MQLPDEPCFVVPQRRHHGVDGITRVEVHNSGNLVLIAAPEIAEALCALFNKFFERRNQNVSDA